MDTFDAADAAVINRQAPGHAAVLPGEHEEFTFGAEDRIGVPPVAPIGQPDISPKPATGFSANRFLVAVIGASAAIAALGVMTIVLVGGPGVSAPTVPVAQAPLQPIAPAAALAAVPRPAAGPPPARQMLVQEPKDLQIQEFLALRNSPSAVLHPAVTAAMPASGKITPSAPRNIAVAKPQLHSPATQGIGQEEAHPIAVNAQIMTSLSQLRQELTAERAQIASMEGTMERSDATLAGGIGEIGRKVAVLDAKLTADERGNSALARAASDDPPAGPAGGNRLDAESIGARAAAPDMTPHKYRVQAASPNLAMLAEVDRSGDDGAQIEVSIGDVVPGYGRVIRITQDGAIWIVETDHGPIE